VHGEGCRWCPVQLIDLSVKLNKRTKAAIGFL
jgi:hypothetical protein